MQLDGATKRKRKSSNSSNESNEKSPVAETKRLKLGDTKDSAFSLTEERPPLAELPIQFSHPIEADNDSDTEWLDACSDVQELCLSHEKLSVDAEEVAERKREKDTIANNVPMGQSDEGDSRSSRLPLRSPSITSLEKLFSRYQQLGSEVDLMNFFKRRGNYGAEARSDELFDCNPGLQPKMRSVLLEWIIEVCDVYKLYRETYHLAVDYVDRYLCKSTNISKYQLQLIGITALLIAAKYEEIYPPKISDFAYITDGACTERDIIEMEISLVEVLEWKCTVITSNSWLLGFLQLLYFHESPACVTEGVLSPLYNSKIYETVAHLMDLCSLDSGFLRFPYKVIALASIHTVIEKPNSIILSASGYSYEDIEDCLNWMQPFWTVLKEKFSYESIKPRVMKPTEVKRTRSFSHMIMKHNIDLDILEAAHVAIGERQKRDELKVMILTPPQSSEKRS